MTKFVANKLKG